MKKKIYIQILGVIACLAVVAMHVNGCFWQFSYDRYWITANIIECICYFASRTFVRDRTMKMIPSAKTAAKAYCQLYPMPSTTV